MVVIGEYIYLIEKRDIIMSKGDNMVHIFFLFRRMRGVVLRDIMIIISICLKKMI